MKVMARDRQQGKTSELVNWLLAENSGPLVDNQGRRLSPYWKRIIVTCHGEREVQRLGFEIRRQFFKVAKDRGWDGVDQSYAGKAVWRIEALRDELRGMQLARRGPTTAVEYAVDDLGYLMDQHISNLFGFRPEIVTIDGEAI